MILYEIQITDNVIEKNEKTFTVYGLVISNGKDVQYLPDISTSKKEVMEIIELCYKYSVSFAHVKDIVEDYIFNHRLHLQ
jgi:hypothetical protein